MIFKYEMQYIGHLVQNSQMHSISNVSFSNSNTFEKFLEIAHRLLVAWFAMLHGTAELVSISFNFSMSSLLNCSVIKLILSSTHTH